jgi:hypothetical protein
MDWDGSAASAPAALTRGLGIMAALAQRRPIRFVPEQPVVASVRHDMVDRRRRLEAPLGLAPHAERMTRQVGRPGSAPAGTVAPARRARALPVQLRLDRRRAPRPRWTVRRRLDGHGSSKNQEPATAKPDGLHSDAHAGRSTALARLWRGYVASSTEPACVFSMLLFGRFCSSAALSRTEILSNAMVHRCQAVVLPIPSRPVMRFHGSPSARSQTRRRSSGSATAARRAPRPCDRSSRAQLLPGAGVCMVPRPASARDGRTHAPAHRATARGHPPLRPVAPRPAGASSVAHSRGATLSWLYRSGAPRRGG